MHIAIVGAGFAGLACAYYASKNLSNFNSITVFQKEHHQDSASWVASGLLHPYSTDCSHLLAFGQVAFQETQQLIEHLEQVSKKAIITSHGILRPSLSDDQYALFASLTALSPMLKILECSEIKNYLPISPNFKNISKALLVKNGLAIDAKEYITELQNACINQGVQCKYTTIENLNQLHSFDCIIVCTGKNLPYFTFDLPSYELIKGQTISYEIESSFSYALHAKAYVVPQTQKNIVTCGATFEKKFINTSQDMQAIERELLPKLSAFVPELVQLPIKYTEVGVRLSPKNHKPFIIRRSPKLFYFGGLGSKGLLYHAFCAKKLIHALIANKMDTIPSLFFHDYFL